MQQAAVRLIIEGDPIGPGILTVLSHDDHGKLHHIGGRLRALATTLGFVIDGDGASAAEYIDVIAHVANTIDDIVQLADALTRREFAA